MAEYKVVAPIQHDEEVFVPGEEVSEGQFGDEKVFQALVESGAVEKVEDPEDLLEPPPNYRDPDLRLASTLTSQGAAQLAIDIPTPTNVPKPGPPPTNPALPTLQVGSPQRQVF